MASAVRGFFRGENEMWILIVVIFLTVLYNMYRYTFGRDEKRSAKDEDFPPYKGYEMHIELHKKRIEELRKIPYKRVNFVARDGVTLSGDYYHAADGAPLVIMFHGYRGATLREGMGIHRMSQEEGYNLLLVDQRAHRNSGGKSITFGVKERYDCVEWIEHMLTYLGKDTKVVIYGLSMGGATVLMATGLGLPENVKGIVADCAYSTAKDIIGEHIKGLHLPVGPVYALIRLSAILFGGFDPEGASAKEALKKCEIPVLFIHGEADTFVPCRMTKENYESCKDNAEMYLVPGAEHGMSYLTNIEKYRSTVKGFLKRVFK